MKSILLYLTLLLPTLLQAAQSGPTVSLENPPAYRVWVFDQAGNRIGQGLYHSNTDSSLVIFNTKRIITQVWQDIEKKEIPYRQIGHIEYREAPEMAESGKKGARKAFWGSAIGSATVMVVGIFTSNEVDSYWLVPALSFITYTAVCIALPVMAAVYLYKIHARKYRKKIILKAGKTDLAPLEKGP